MRFSTAHWGDAVTRNKRSNRLTVEKLGTDCLDVRALQRAGTFRDRRVALPMASFRWPSIDRMCVSRGLIQLELHNRLLQQQIRVSWTRCYFGGTRPWLHCPFCQRRVARLFKGMAGYFCRACVGNPIYASQGKSTQNRRHFEACKLRLRLDGNASLAEPFPTRPRGMHWSTYERLRRRGEALEAGLSVRFKAKPPDYPNLIYYLSFSK